MTKTNMVLGAILVLQVVAILIFSSGSGGASSVAAETKKLFDGIDAAGILQISIEDDEGETLELMKQDGAWTVASAGGYPVSEGKVDPVLDKILDLETGRPVTRKAKNHRKLEVSDGKFQRKVKMRGDGDRDLGTLYLGSSSNYNLHNIRKGGEEVVFMASGLSPWELATSPSSWIDTKWFGFEKDDVTSVRFEAEGEVIAVKRNEDGGWGMTSPEERSVSKEKMDSVLRAFATGYLKEPIGKDEDPAFGFETPTAVVELVLAKMPEPDADTDPDAEEPADPVIENQRFVIGAKTDDESYYVKRSGSDFIVTMTSSMIEQKFLKSLEDFMPDVEGPDDDGDEFPEFELPDIDSIPKE